MKKKSREQRGTTGSKKIFKLFYESNKKVRFLILFS